MATLVVLALAGCVPTQAYEGAVESSLVDLPAVDSVEISSHDPKIGFQGQMNVDVVLRPGSEPAAIGDVVDAWTESSSRTVVNSLVMQFADHADNTDSAMYLSFGVDEDLSAYRGAAVEWATLAADYSPITSSVSRFDMRSNSIVLPQMDAPGAVRAAVEELRAAIVDVDTKADWMISSTADQFADQGLAVLSQNGLPTDDDIEHVETLGAAFANAQALGDVQLTTTYNDDWTTIDVDLSPRELHNIRSDEVAAQLVASAVWPIVTDLVNQVGGRESPQLKLSTFGTVFAVLYTSDCERPATERFPLDFEVWDYWASVRSVCLP